MALFESHSSANKIVDELPRTTEMTWTYTDGSLQPHAITRTDYYERFRYVFMTQSAAEACQSAELARLVPQYPVVGVDVNVDIRAYPTHDGVAWEVSVAYHRISHVEQVTP